MVEKGATKCSINMLFVTQVICTAVTFMITFILNLIYKTVVDLK